MEMLFKNNLNSFKLELLVKELISNSAATFLTNAGSRGASSIIAMQQRRKTLLNNRKLKAIKKTAKANALASKLKK